MKRKKKRTDELAVRVRAYASEQGITAAEAVRELIERGLVEQNPREARPRLRPIRTMEDLEQYRSSDPDIGKLVKIVRERFGKKRRRSS